MVQHDLHVKEKASVAVGDAMAVSVDSLPPPAIAAKAEDFGTKKQRLHLLSVVLLSVLAGAFISLGAIFSTVTLTGSAELPFGVARLLGGLTFCLGLILVVVGGAELVTGNVLLVIATASGKLPFAKLLENWVVVFLGNLFGAVLTAFLIFHTAQYTMADGALGLTALKIGDTKCALTFTQALTRGIFCNALVCLAVWMCFSCRTTGDKILAILFPITAFVAAGFEHSVANMYFIPIALFIKQWAIADFWTAIGMGAGEFTHLTWSNFFIANLLPVTLGNIIGGGGFVGMIYWMCYCRGRKTGK